MKTRKLTTMALLVAMSIVLVWIGRFVPFFSMSFLEYDPADIPILIGTFAYGPAAGLMLTVVASVIQGVTVSAGSSVYGIIMQVIATAMYVIVAGFIYKYKRTISGAAIALVCGTIAMTAVMVGANLIITPIFMGAPRQTVVELLIPVIIPFNLLKASINGAVTFIAYKPISKLFKDAPGMMVSAKAAKNEN